MNVEKKSLSVVIPTIGRKKELLILLDTLSYSDIRPLEVIIVDQNPVSFFQEMLSFEKYDLDIRYFNVDFKGASKARNFGLSKVRGDYVCFPDDDCEIFSDTFTYALKFLGRYPVVFGKCVDRDGKDSVIKFCHIDGELTKSNMNGRFVEATIFIDTKLMKKYLFDENLGVGTFHGAEEAYDLVYRLLSNNIVIYYSNSIRFYHPNKVVDYSNVRELRRVFSYRCGLAALCMKHHLYKKYFSRLLLVGLYIPILVLLNRNKVRYYCSEFLGLITGAVIK
ncbi:glycosyltransferase family 2 protein [Bacteroides nordii]|uniref:glycosyltransferase family 2 protein n=1 Tax=Bacteroides nordii TaxID=291645 RepID=UPI00399BF86B